MAYGPGVFDMQTSLVLVEFGLRAVRDLNLALARPVVILITSDEEIGSGTSRELIEAEAQAAAYVLVMESPLPGGVIKTARKGTGTFTVETTGRAAHAGVDPYKGVNAIEEMAHQVLAVHALADREKGTTLCAGVIAGGTATNVVPAHCTAQIDVRAWTKGEAERIEQAMHALTPKLVGAHVRVTGGWNRPPLERSVTADLFEHACASWDGSLGWSYRKAAPAAAATATSQRRLASLRLTAWACRVMGHMPIMNISWWLKCPSHAALLVSMWLELSAGTSVRLAGSVARLAPDPVPDNP